ncbi:MAG: hypothetical protein ACM336_08560 [Acidobacteriota bacterium]
MNADKRRLGLLLGAAGCLLAAYWAGRMAWAEILFVSGRAEGAAALMPGNAEYLARAGDLEGAVRANPRDSESLVALGLRAEMRGDFAAAERWMLAAADCDRGYDPRWSLANFYFRRGNEAAFWKWGLAAAEMGNDPRALWALYWRFSTDGAEIVRRGVPATRQALRSYVWFLMGWPEWGQAGPAAARLMARADPEDAQVLTAYCERLLGAGRGGEALALWEELGRRGLTLPHTGFDWRLGRVEGVSASEGAAGVRVSLSGSQPERCEVLWRYAAWEAGAAYALRFEYMTSGIRAGSGLRWRVRDGAGRTVAESEDLASEEWKRGEVRFAGPEGLGRVSLGYVRAPGTVRVEGVVRVRGVELEVDR